MNKFIRFAILAVLLFVLLGGIVRAASPVFLVQRTYELGASPASIIRVTTHLDNLDAAGGICGNVTIALLPGPDTVTSLREAICASNNNSGADMIEFRIPGSGARTISLQSELPTITDQVTIDGYSQSDATCNTWPTGNNAVIRIKLNGFSTPEGTYGLTIAASNTVVRGLWIYNFCNDLCSGGGIAVTAGSGNRIEGNFIGWDGTSTYSGANGTEVRIDTSGNSIGGGTPCTRNLLPGSTGGVLPESAAIIWLNGASATDNLVQGNYISTNVQGTGPVGSGLGCSSLGRTT